MRKVKSELRPDRTWETTRWGRFEQGLRELAVVLGREVTVQDFARHIGLTSSSLNGWKNGSRPREQNLERVAAAFAHFGLDRFSARYLDYGDGHKLSEAPPAKMKRVGTR